MAQIFERSEFCTKLKEGNGNIHRLMTEGNSEISTISTLCFWVCFAYLLRVAHSISASNSSWKETQGSEYYINVKEKVEWEKI